MNYYNENNRSAADWLRYLIKQKLIPDGVVDERSIEDVLPSEIMEFQQCHFFAGIGGWSYALQLANWPQDKSVWTGSCPCQPFSSAGKKRGAADKRHLWPAFKWLIQQCRPSVVFGEQVTGKVGREWLNGIFIDLEVLGYCTAAADLCAAGVDAPHIRQRLFWVADTYGRQRPSDSRATLGNEKSHGEKPDLDHKSQCAGENRLGNGVGKGFQKRIREPGLSGSQSEEYGKGQTSESPSAGNGMAHPGLNGRDQERKRFSQEECHGTFRNPWADYFWIECGDGKARRVKPGVLPLAYGLPGRVEQIKGYGNAIVPQVASVFLESYLALKRRY